MTEELRFIPKFRNYDLQSSLVASLSKIFPRLKKLYLEPLNLNKGQMKVVELYKNLTKLEDISIVNNNLEPNIDSVLGFIG